jgi:selenocysteine lyase/cysteine desulfurase
MIEKIEHDLVEYFLEKANSFNGMKIVGSTQSKNRVSVFGFTLE